MSCAGVLGVCGPEVDMPPAELCAPLCTGIMAGYGYEGGNPDAAACIGELSACPDSDPFSAVFDCAVPPFELSEACVALCGKVSACKGEEDAGCPGGCSQLELQDPEAFSVISECVEAAGEDCGALGACLPNDGGGGDAPLMCEQTCVQVESCSDTPDSPTPQCLGSCIGAIDSEITMIAVAACQASASCPDLEACYALIGEPALAECTTACESASMCADWPGETCGLVCSGALTGLGLGGTSTAECVVGKIGAECSVDAGECAL